MTPPQSAAVRLARIVDRISPSLAFMQDGLYRDYQEYQAALDAFRREPHPAPSAPALSELEREYLEACYRFDVDVQAGRESGPDNAAIRVTFKALHAARTRSEPDAQFWRDEAHAILDRHEGTCGTMDGEPFDRLRKCIDQAIAERTRRG